MNLTRLESFVAVVDAGSVTAGARYLGIGQSAVSKHLKGLEQEFGVELMSRKPNSVELTMAGRRLLPIARKVVRSLIIAQELLTAEG